MSETQTPSSPATAPSASQLLAQLKVEIPVRKVDLSTESVPVATRREHIKPIVKQSVNFELGDEAFTFLKTAGARSVQLVRATHILVERVESPMLNAEGGSLADTIGQRVESTHVNLIGEILVMDGDTTKVAESGVELLRGYATQGVLNSGINKGKVGLIVSWQATGAGEKYKVTGLYYAKPNDPLVENMEPEEIQALNQTNQNKVTDLAVTKLRSLMYVSGSAESAEVDEKIKDIITNLKTSEPRTRKEETETEDNKQMSDVPNMND